MTDLPFVSALVQADLPVWEQCLQTEFLQKMENGTLSEDEALMNLVSMLIAGHETTVTLIGNGMLCLLRNPEQLAAMKADRSLVPSAVEECMRYKPGGNMILRVAIEDFPIGDLVIPAGSMVLGFIGAVLGGLWVLVSVWRGGR